MLEGRAPVLRSDGSPAARLPLRRGRGERLPGDRRRPRPRRGPGEAFNAGGGAPHAVGEVVRTSPRWRARRSSPRSSAGQSEGEIDRQYVDASKLRELRLGAEVELRTASDGRSSGIASTPRRARSERALVDRGYESSASWFEVGGALDAQAAGGVSEAAVPSHKWPRARGRPRGPARALRGRSLGAMARWPAR